MEEQLISFPTAKLAKVLGFDEPCEKLYLQPGNKPDSPVSRAFLKNSDLFEGSIFSHTAPTQSLLQKWLREVHQLQVHTFHNMHFCWQVQVQDISGPEQWRNRTIDQKWLMYDYFTYKEALEAGLSHALSFLK